MIINSKITNDEKFDIFFFLAACAAILYFSLTCEIENHNDDIDYDLKKTLEIKNNEKE